jgi:hypothetical protein
MGPLQEVGAAAGGGVVSGESGRLGVGGPRQVKCLPNTVRGALLPSAQLHLECFKGKP